MALIQDHILSRNLDFFNIVETHHESSLSPGLIASTPPTYSFIEKARPMPAGASTVRGPRGGGICIIYKDHYQASVKDTGLFTTFEHLTGYFTLRSFHVLVIAIYRPGSEPVRSSFFTELANLLDTIAKYNCDVIILGDINIHLDELDNADTKHFNKLLLSHGFEQLVHLPTHSRNHTLDIVVARSPNSLISTIDIDHPSFSDHSMIHFHIHHQLSPAIFETVERRSFMNFDTLSFEKDLLGTELFQLSSCYTSTNRSADELFSLYDSTMEILLNKHAPRRKIRFRKKAESPWFDKDCSASKRSTRRLERSFLLDKSNKQRRELWRTGIKAQRRLFQHKHSSYLRRRIEDVLVELSGNHYTLFSLPQQKPNLHLHQMSSWDTLKRK